MRGSVNVCQRALDIQIKYRLTVVSLLTENVLDTFNKIIPLKSWMDRNANEK